MIFYLKSLWTPHTIRTSFYRQPPRDKFNAAYRGLTVKSCEVWSNRPKLDSPFQKVPSTIEDPNALHYISNTPFDDIYYFLFEVLMKINEEMLEKDDFPQPSIMLIFLRN